MSHADETLDAAILAALRDGPQIRASIDLRLEEHVRPAYSDLGRALRRLSRDGCIVCGPGLGWRLTSAGIARLMTRSST